LHGAKLNEKAAKISFGGFFYGVGVNVNL